MKITVQDFGIIHEFSFDTDKNFTMVFGKNNTGKSYALSLVYLIIKNILRMEEPYFLHTLVEIQDVEKKIESYQGKLEGKKTLDIKSDIEDFLKHILSRTFLVELEESFKNTFDSLESLQNRLNKEADLQIDIELDILTFCIKVKEKKLYIENLQVKREKIEIKNSQRNLNTKDNNNVITIYTSKNKDHFFTNLLQFIIDLSMKLSHETKEKIKSIYYLPASRSGLYQALSAFGQIIAELSKSRKFTTKRIELPSISEPLSDYFLELSNIKIRKQEIENNITFVANAIEKEILHGKVEFDKTTKKLIFKPEDTDLRLDLSYTSSMVSELSPIASYLKYIVNYSEDNSIQSLMYPRKRKYNKAKALIIIEEPEAHLHPSVQIQMIEKFAELALNDIKMVISTHSNYMFNKSNNLILAKKVDIAYVESLLFEESKVGSIAKSIAIDQYGQTDENFIDTTEELYNEKLRLIELYNENK